MDMPTVAETARRIRTGEESATSLTRRCLDAVAESDGPLNAWVHLDPEGALATAAKVDAAVAAGRLDNLGPLAGVPFGVKDLEDCAGMPTTRGSRWFAGRPPETADSIHVGRLRAAGAVPIGKTATPEFGAWAYTASPLLGVTRNPWDPSRTPGGSSGGSAAAVSSGMVPFATASDGGGSIRTPAAFTGLVGLRATYGRIPTFGDTHLAQNAVVGALTTTVADTALLLDVMAGPDGRDRTCLPPPTDSYVDALEHLDLSGLRVAWSADLGFAIVDPEVAAVAERAAHAFAAATGAVMVDRPLALRDYTLTYVYIEGVDKFVGIDRSLWESRLDELDPLCAPAWEHLSRRTLPEAAEFESLRRELVGEVAPLFDDVDLLLTPMASVPPFAAEGPMPTTVAGIEVHAGMSVVLAFLASLVNLPALSVPAGLTAGGLPVGLQVVGPRFGEDLVLAAAARYEAANPWPRHCGDPQPAPLS
jgi:Asp-tRNA(Asn)/Glu-tRNA(Gln) amidotransferase A subunit family amidase